MDTDRFISLIRPPVREFIHRVASETTDDPPGSIIIECELTGKDNDKFGKEFTFDTKIVPHPSRNMPGYGHRDLFTDAAETIAADPDISRSFPPPDGGSEHDPHDPEVHQWEQKLIELSWKVMDYEGDFTFSNDAFLTAANDHLLVDTDDHYHVLIPLLNVVSNIDQIPLQVEAKDVHPHDENPFVVRELSIEQFGDAALSAILTYEGFLPGPTEDLYASSSLSFIHPSHHLRISFDSLYNTNFGLRSISFHNSHVAESLLEKSRATGERVLSALRLDDSSAIPSIGQAYIVNRDWRTYRSDINSIDLYRPWTAGYDPALWNRKLAGRNYTIDERSITHLQRFWLRYSPEISFSEGSTFERSLSRFNEIYNRANPKDQIVDAVIVFEGLLTKGCEIGGLGVTMALIGSILLDNRSNRPREELRSFFRNLAFARGEIVHKDATWASIVQTRDFDPTGKGDPSIHEFVEETRDIISKTILEYMDQRCRNDRSIGDTNILIYNAMRDAESPNLELVSRSMDDGHEEFNFPGDSGDLVDFLLQACS